MALMYGAQAVWVGTRFVCSEEAGASMAHKNAIIDAGYGDTVRTVIYTGRPARVIKNRDTEEWQKEGKREEMKRLLSKGIVPMTDHELDSVERAEDNKNNKRIELKRRAPVYIAGQVAGAIEDILPAKVIIQKMVAEAIEAIQVNGAKIKVLEMNAKL